MSKYATVENAEAIANATSRALQHLLEAGRELENALELARDDYSGNANKLEQIVGGLGLVAAATSLDHYTWDDYARARARNRDRLFQQLAESIIL